MFATLFRPFRATYRYLSRTPIEKREQEELAVTRKSLLAFRAARESSFALRGMLRERVARLSGELDTARQGMPEKRAFDWARMDHNTLVGAIKDDLYEAEKQLHEQEHNFEHNDCNVATLERRESRLVASLARRSEKTAEVETPQNSITKRVAREAAEGRVLGVQVGADVAARHVPQAVRQNPSDMGGLVTS